MSEDSVLVLIAEVAAALAGFSGVAAAFGRRQERSWSRVEQARLADLLNHSGIALFAAFATLVAAQREGFSPELWRNSSLFWAGFAVVGIGLRVRSLRLDPAVHAIRRSAVSLSAFVALLIFQLFNAWTWRLAWPYLLALVANLGFAFIQFMGLVNPSRTDDAA